MSDPLQQAVEQAMLGANEALLAALVEEQRADGRTPEQIIEYRAQQLTQAIRGEIKSTILSAWKGRGVRATYE